MVVVTGETSTHDTWAEFQPPDSEEDDPGVGVVMKGQGVDLSSLGVGPGRSRRRRAASPTRSLADQSILHSAGIVINADGSIARSPTRSPEPHGKPEREAEVMRYEYPQQLLAGKAAKEGTDAGARGVRERGGGRAKGSWRQHRPSSRLQYKRLQQSLPCRCDDTLIAPPPQYSHSVGSCDGMNVLVYIL